jgi:hypothetical protein
MKPILKIIWEEMYYAAALLRIGGLKVFLKQLKRQVYSKDAQIGLKLDLQETDIPEIKANIKYTLQLAKKEDMDEILQLAKKEDKKWSQSLVYRRWLYEDGYHNCYITRTVDTNDLCFIQSVIHPEDDRIVKGRFRHWFPKLKEGEALLEGAYTFGKYRGNKLHPSVLSVILNMYKNKGFKRIITHIEKGNVAALKGAERVGFIPFEEAPELRIFFLTKRKFNRTDR